MDAFVVFLFDTLFVAVVKAEELSASSPLMDKLHAPEFVSSTVNCRYAFIIVAPWGMSSAGYLKPIT